MLHWVELIALRPLAGSYGHPNTGQRFRTDNLTADDLMARGLAERYREPGKVANMLAAIFGKMQPPHENKMLVPPSNKEEPPEMKPKRGRPRKGEDASWLSPG